MSSLAPRAVLFDMDGVLVFSEDAWFLVFNDTLHHFGHEPIERPEFAAQYGQGTQSDRDLYMPERSVADVDAAYSDFFANHLDAVRRNDEADAALGALVTRGLAIAVATNTHESLARRILDRVGLLRHFGALAAQIAPAPAPANPIRRSCGSPRAGSA